MIKKHYSEIKYYKNAIIEWFQLHKHVNVSVFQ